MERHRTIDPGCPGASTVRSLSRATRGSRAAWVAIARGSRIPDLVSTAAVCEDRVESTVRCRLSDFPRLPFLFSDLDLCVWMTYVVARQYERAVDRPRSTGRKESGAPPASAPGTRKGQLLMAGLPQGAGVDDLQTQPVFLACGARFGSTLLRYLLRAHPDVWCPAETNLASAFSAVFN